MALRQATERMTLDVSRLEVQTSLAVTQGDTMRRWEIKLTDRGQPIEIGKRWTAAMSGIKPDGKVIYNGCTVQDGRIIYDFASGTEIATAAGAYEITLGVYDEAGEILHAPKIWLNVLQNRNRSIASDDQFTAAQEIIRRINEAEEDIDGIEQTNEQQGDDIEAAQEDIRYLESKTTTVQTVSVPKSSWTNSDTVNVILDKPAPASNALIIPANADTRRQVVICQIEVEDERETEDGWIVSLSRSEVIPETDLEFVVYVMRGDTEREIDSTALLLAPAGGEANIRIADDLTTDIGYVALSARMGKKLNEEKVPTTRTVNKKPLSADVNLTAADVGAAPAYTAKSMNDCTTLQEIYNLFRGDYSVRLHGEVGAQQNTNLKTLLGSSLAGAMAFNTNYIDVYAELVGNMAGTVRLTAVDATNSDNVAYGYIYFNPNLSRSGWSGWQTADYRIVANVMEWINPPMEVDVEYRTTERWNGKPVYVKAFSIGEITTATITLPVSNVESVIDWGGVDSFGSKFPFYNKTNGDEVNGVVHPLNTTSVALQLYTKNDLSNLTGTVWTKYTKTT